MKAVLFVGHGSRLAEGNEEVRTFVEQMRPTFAKDLIVETCFLEFEAPTISQGIARCVEQGATEVNVIPIILLHAGHSKLHIPAEIMDGIEMYPNVKFTYGQTISVHTQVLEILVDRLKEIGFDTDAKHEDTAILLIGRGGSDVGANGDFYKITRMLWETLQVKWVESAFMGVTDPLVDEGMARCIKLGAKKIIMLPYFLFTGILMERMMKMQKAFAVEYPGIDIELANYFGYHSKLQTILKERVIEAMEGKSTGAQDLENYLLYVEEHGPAHHHHCSDCHIRCHTPQRCAGCHHGGDHDHAHDDHDHHHDHSHDHHEAAMDK